MTYQEIYNRNSGLQQDAFGSNHGEPPSDGSNTVVDLQEYLAIIQRRRWAMLATILVVFVLGTLYMCSRRPIYGSTAMIVVSTRGGSLSSSASLPMLGDLQALTSGRSIDTQQEIISSQDLLDKAYKSLPASIREAGFDSSSIPAWAYDISNKKNTDVLIVTCHAYTREAAVALANGIVATYFKQDLDRNSQAISQARKYAEDQMKTIENDLRKATYSVAEYKRKSGMLDAVDQMQKFSEYQAKLQIDLDASKHDYASNQQAISAIQKQLGNQKEEILSQSTITRNPEYMAAVENINQLHMKRTAAMQEYRLDSKEIKQFDGQIVAEQARLKKIADTIVGSQTTSRNPVWESMFGKYTEALVNDSVLSTRIASVKSTLDNQISIAARLPEKERELSERLQTVALLRNTYELLSQKYYTLLLAEQSTLPTGMLVSQARPALTALYPKKTKSAILFFMMGIILSFLIAAILERMDIRVHDQTFVERVTGLSTLGVIPLIDDDTPTLISDAQHNSTLLESYRILRSNVAFSSIDHEIKLLAVSGPGRSEGKSTTAANIAIAMAMDGKKVLIVDCDMRRPSLHRVFGVSRSIGLTSVVTGKADIQDAIIKTNIENLSLLPSGPTPPNPPEVLNSQHTRELLRSLTEQYDFVLLDCPPCTGLSDVQVISTIVDGLLLVISMNQTVKPHLYITLRTLAQVDAPVIGTVLNKMDIRHHSYYYYYYYSYNYNQDGADMEKSASGRKHRKSNKSKPTSKV